MTLLESTYLTKHAYTRKVVWSWYKNQPDLIEDIVQEFYLWLCANIHKYSYDKISFDRWLRMNLIYFLKDSKKYNRNVYKRYVTHQERANDLPLFTDNKDVLRFEQSYDISKLTNSQQELINNLLTNRELNCSKQNVYQRLKVIKRRMYGLSK